MSISKIKDEFGNTLREHELLKDHVPLQVGGVADYFIAIDKITDLLKLLPLVFESKLPFLLYSSGAHTLFSDYGFPGLVIQNKTKNIIFSPGSSQIIVDAGMSLFGLITSAANKNLGGLEFLANSDGTVGGELFDYVNYHTGNFHSLVKKITIFSASGEILLYKGSWLSNGKTISRLKSNPNKYILINATLQLQNARQEDIIRRISISKKNHNPGLGDIFLNPPLGDVQDLLIKSNVKRLKVGDAYVSSDNPNQIQNRKNAQAEDVRQLIEFMRQAVLEKTSILLEDRISFLGNWNTDKEAQA